MTDWRASEIPTIAAGGVRFAERLEALKRKGDGLLAKPRPMCRWVGSGWCLFQLFFIRQSEQPEFQRFGAKCPGFQQGFDDGEQIGFAQFAA